MKKLFTFCLLGLSAAAFAQSSIAVYLLNPNTGAVTSTLSNGYSLMLTTLPNNITTTKIEIKNTSAVSHTYNVTRTILTQNPTMFTDGNGNNKPNPYFCCGQTCFGSNISTADPANYTFLGPGDDSQATGQFASIYVSEAANIGYYVINYKVFDVNNPSDSSSFNAVYNGTTSVGFKSLDKADLVSELYPNPNTNGSPISFDLDNDQDLKFQVYNSLGSLVFSANKQKYAAGKNKLALDCSTLSNGIYFVTISSNSAQTTKRIVISNK